MITTTKCLFILLLLALSGELAFAQYGFGTNSPDPTAVIDMTAGNKGFLIPRVALGNTASAAPIYSPANSLLVFNTNTSWPSNSISPGYYYWSAGANGNNGGWIRLFGRNDLWSITGNSGTTPGSNYLGTSDNANLVVKANAATIMEVSSTGPSIKVGSGSSHGYSSLLETVDNSSILLPRLSTAQLSTIKSFTEGMLVYNTDENCLLYYTNGAFNKLDTPCLAYAAPGAAFSHLRNGWVNDAYTGNNYTVNHTTGEKFSDNTACVGSTISTDGCAGIASVDYNGNTYNLVDINGQCWMGKDLIAPGPDYSPKYSNITYYYYTWAKAMNSSTEERSQGVCPTGFHIPSECEFKYLEHGLGLSIAQTNGTILKSMDTNGAFEGGIVMADKLLNRGGGVTGFNAFLNGYHGQSYYYFPKKTSSPTRAYWWTSTRYDSSDIKCFCIDKDGGFSFTHDYDDVYYSIRCLKD